MTVNHAHSKLVKSPISFAEVAELSRHTLGFQGFAPGLFRFLANLSQHNNKEWFDLNRRYYDANVLDPIRQFTGEVGAVLGLLNDELDTQPKVGRTISRINNDLRGAGSKMPYRPFVSINFSRKGEVCSRSAILYIRFYGRGVAIGFYPGSQPPRTGLIQTGIKNNVRLFQRYLDERRVASRYSELVCTDGGQVTRWPLPQTARRWASLESFTVGEYFDHTDPVLYSSRFRHRVIEVLYDLYPLWLFAFSETIKDDLELYRENRLLIESPRGIAAD